MEKEDINFRIKKIGDLLERNANTYLKKLDLTFSQARVLRYLMVQDGKKAKLKELERSFQVSQPTMAGIAARLEEKGFVYGCVDSSDKRVKIITLTESGKEVCKKAREEAMLRQEQMTEVLGDENRKELCRLLDIYYKYITQEI